MRREKVGESRRRLSQAQRALLRIAHYRKTGLQLCGSYRRSLPFRTPPGSPDRPAGMGNPLGRATRPSVIGSVCN